MRHVIRLKSHLNKTFSSSRVILVGERLKLTGSDCERLPYFMIVLFSSLNYQVPLVIIMSGKIQQT